MNIPYPGIYLSNDGMTVVKQKFNNYNNQKQEVRVCDAIWIEEVYRNIDDDNVSAKIGFLSSGREIFLTANRVDYLNLQNILKFQKQGLDVLHTNVKDVIAHLRNEEYMAPQKYQHLKLGFDTYDSKTVFKHYKIYGGNIKSDYVGSYAIKPEGSREKWMKMYYEQVQGCATLELICVISLSATVLGYLGADLGLDSIICHLAGNSSTGKSTAMKLAISMFGYPDVKENGLFTSYNSTANALIKALAGIKGVPVAFDEISMANDKDLCNLVYKLSNGADKSRMNKNSELRSKETWLTTILSNGEEPIVQSSHNTGVYNRVFEFDNITWTKDSKNAERIKKVISKNYGFIGTEFVEYIMKQGKNQVYKLYEENKRKLKEIFNQRKVQDNFTDRRINNHAILMTTAILFEQAFDIQVCKDEMLDILIGVEKESIEKRNFDKTAIDFIYDFITININKFSLSYKPQGLINPKEPQAEHWGKIMVSESNIEVEINPVILDKALTKGNFKNAKVVLKQLRDSGHLDHEDNKLYRKRKNQFGKLAKVYVVIIKNEDEDERFEEINKLLDEIRDSNKRTLLIKEKERMKDEIKDSEER